jgi:hypothetical protein
MKDKMQVLNTYARVDRIEEFRAIVRVMPVDGTNRVVFAFSDKISIPVDEFGNLWELIESYKEETVGRSFNVVISSMKSQLSWFIQLKLLRGDYLFEDEEGEDASSIVLEDGEVAEFEESLPGFFIYDLVTD